MMIVSFTLIKGKTFADFIASFDNRAANIYTNIWNSLQ